MTSQLNDLKSQHIADEVKKVDDKVKKNITDILNTKTSLEHNKSVIDDLERSSSIADEVKKVDDKVKKNITDILNTKTSLEHNKSVIDDLVLTEDFIITINNFTFFLNQSLNHSLKIEKLLMHGYQQEIIMTVIILTCFL